MTRPIGTIREILYGKYPTRNQSAGSKDAEGPVNWNEVAPRSFGSTEAGTYIPVR